jgi:phosphatidylserine/phosphatidylglycerophosphate/cardiolipin synthase-like enzyme
VLFESYIVEDERRGAEFADLLLRKAAEGVKVALLYDSVGSMAATRPSSTGCARVAWRCAPSTRSTRWSGPATGG